MTTLGLGNLSSFVTTTLLLLPNWASTVKMIWIIEMSKVSKVRRHNNASLWNFIVVNFCLLLLFLKRKNENIFLLLLLCWCHICYAGVVVVVVKLKEHMCSLWKNLSLSMSLHFFLLQSLFLFTAKIIKSLCLFCLFQLLRWLCLFIYVVYCVFIDV